MSDDGLLAPGDANLALHTKHRPEPAATPLDIAELRTMIRNVQMSVARIEAALGEKPARKVKS